MGFGPVELNKLEVFVNRIAKYIKTGLLLVLWITFLISSAEAVKGDKRITQTLSLENGLDVLLVSDPDVHRSAAALSAPTAAAPSRQTKRVGRAKMGPISTFLLVMLLETYGSEFPPWFPSSSLGTRGRQQRSMQSGKRGPKKVGPSSANG